MPNFTAGTSFTDGVTNDVTAAKLNALVADAVPTSSLSLNSTTGTIATFNSTTGTIATLNSTTGTIATLNSTTGTIATLNSTTPTFLGAITASTNTINVGSGQIYKDASGNVGVGTASPAGKLHVNGQTYIQGTVSGGLANSTLIANSSGQAQIWALGSDASTTGSMTFVVARSNLTSSNQALTIDSSGNVGIGNSSPSYLQHNYSLTENATALALSTISNSSSAGSLGLVTKLRVGAMGASNNNGVSEIHCLHNLYNDSKSALKFLTNDGSSLAERLHIDSSGDVTIARLAGSGSRAVNASAAGLLSAASDASLKEEVVGAHIAGLDEILQIHPKMYRWKDDIANRGENASVELGFIANDVAPIIPSAAPLGNDGLYGFYDRSITAALVKAVQELSAKVTALEAA
jgi:hypothetical protein